MKTKPGRTRTLDVRPIIADGGSPLEAVMDAVGALSETESLLLVTPFLPSPLIEKLNSEGFTARPERRNDGAWETRFSRLSKGE